MSDTPTPRALANRFAAVYGTEAHAIASAPGRIEVLGNHTDYNAGLTLSCAVGLRCFAAIAPLSEPAIRLASTAYGQPPQQFDLADPVGEPGHWTNYVLGLVAALHEQGHQPPGFALLIDSAVPRSAGVSSSAALEMAALTALLHIMRADLTATERARLGQFAESRAVGAQTGLLDQLTSLCGKRDHLLRIDFSSLEHRAIPLPPGYALFAIDSGVKHDLTHEYNDCRAACESAARAMGVANLRAARLESLEQRRDAMPDHVLRCARHVINENRRVELATQALQAGDIQSLGRLMTESHTSSRDDFNNSCPELDHLIEFARRDARCLGARLSGGGFGGISIHLVKQEDAEPYRQAITEHAGPVNGDPRWSAVCTIDSGATVHGRQ